MGTNQIPTPKHYDLTEAEFSQLMSLVRVYHRNAQSCLESKAYVAGCATAGAALEASLVAMVHINWRQIPDSFIPPRRSGQPKPLLDWGFDDLLTAAHEAGWLPQTSDFRNAFDAPMPAAGDYASQLRLLRNLIHPQRYLRDHPGRPVTEGMLEYAIEIAGELGARLGAIVEVELAKKLEDE